MMKIYRKEREVVQFRKQISNIEDKLKAREAKLISAQQDLTAKQREIVAKDRELALKEREMRVCFEEESQKMRERINSEVRAEWKIKAEAEIARQVENGRLLLDARFEQEVSHRVEVEVTRRIRELNLIPASSVPSLSSSSASSNSTAPSLVSPFPSSPRRTQDIHNLRSQSPVDVDMASPQHHAIDDNDPRYNTYDQKPPLLNLRADLDRYHIDDPPNQRFRNNNSDVNDNATMHDLFEDSTVLSDVPPTPSRANGTKVHSASVGSPQLRTTSAAGIAKAGGPSPGLKRSQTTTGVNLFPNATRPSSSNSNDDFSMKKAVAFNSFQGQPQNQNTTQNKEVIRGYSMVQLAMQKREADEAEKLRQQREKYSDVAPTWDRGAEDCPTPFISRTRRYN